MFDHFIDNLSVFVQNVEADETIESRDCVQWNRDQDSGKDYWSKEGCQRMPDEGDLTVCACDRFANFAVLFVSYGGAAMSVILCVRKKYCLHYKKRRLSNPTIKLLDLPL